MALDNRSIPRQIFYLVIVAIGLLALLILLADRDL